jgi:glycosyltransferase involved in cell wall biosynthesis
LGPQPRVRSEFNIDSPTGEKEHMIKQRLGYLSGAPRVSTRPSKESVSPRAHVLGVMGAFQELGWEVKPFIVGDRSPRRWTAEGSQRALSAGPISTLAADLMRLALGSLNARRAWRELGGEVDWVYERLAVLQSLGWIFKEHGTPWILETNGPLFYEAKAERNAIVLGKVARWLELKAYRECDVLVCISEAVKEIALREANVRPEKIVVMPNGVDTAFFDPGRCDPKRLFTNFTVGFVGTFFPWQALDLVLEAVKDVRAEGLDISLVIVGDGVMREAWEAKTKELGLSAAVVFTGMIPWQAVPQTISGFDVGYSGPVQMGLGGMYHSPLKIYEYMAMAKPVVAAAHEDARRAIRDGETGFLFQGGDKNDLKRALAKAYRSRGELPKMGRKARQEAVTHHSWTARVRTLISEVERIRGET